MNAIGPRWPASKAKSTGPNDRAAISTKHALHQFVGLDQDKDPGRYITHASWDAGSCFYAGRAPGS
jgi:hypothetical protein